MTSTPPEVDLRVWITDQKKLRPEPGELSPKQARQARLEPAPGRFLPGRRPVHKAYKRHVGPYHWTPWEIFDPGGKAVRVGSVATRAQISPTRRPYHDHQAYCFFLVEGTCGQCVDRWRLPGGAGAADPPPAGDRMDDPRWLDARSEPSARFLDPLVKLAGGLCADAAGGLAGNWLFVLTSLVVLCLNVLGEELWWRDYILPRQELAIGRRAWLMHGLLWTAFHAAMWWNLLNLLPLALGLAFVTVRRESTKTGIVTHVFQKLDYFVMTLPLFLSILEVP